MTLPDLEQRFRVLTVIWIGLMGGVALFAAAVYFLLSTGSASTPDLELAGFLPTAGALAVAGMAVGLVLGRRLEARIGSGEPADRFQQYQTARIVSLAIVEGMGLFVIALSFVSGAGTWALGAGAVTIWVMVLGRPRRQDVDRLLR